MLGQELKEGFDRLHPYPKFPSPPTKEAVGVYFDLERVKWAFDQKMARAIAAILIEMAQRRIAAETAIMPAPKADAKA